MSRLPRSAKAILPLLLIVLAACGMVSEPAKGVKPVGPKDRLEFDIVLIEGTVREVQVQPLTRTEAKDAESAVRKYIAQKAKEAKGWPAEQTHSPYFYQIYNPACGVSDAIYHYTAMAVEPPVWEPQLRKDDQDVYEFALTHLPPYDLNGPMMLKSAAEALGPEHPKPWTATRVIGWFEQAKSEQDRQQWAIILAASGDARAVATLGRYLEKNLQAPNQGRTLSTIARELSNNYYGPNWRRDRVWKPGEANYSVNPDVSFALMWWDRNKEKINALIPGQSDKQ